MDQQTNPEPKDEQTGQKPTAETEVQDTTPQPVAETADLPPVMAAPASEPKKTILKRKWFLPLAIAASILLLGGAGAAAYYGVIVPRQPKYVLARAIGNTVSDKKISSGQYDGTFSITDKESKKTYAGSFNGAADSKNLALSAAIGIEGTTLKLDVRTIDNNSAYLKVDGLKGLSDILTASGDKTLAQSAPFVEALNGQWVSFDQNALKSLGANTSTEKFSLSDKDAKKIEELYKKHLFFEVTKTYADQQIGGVNSHHYQVKVNRDELYAFLKDVKAADIENVNITDDMLTQVKKSQIGKYPFEIWVDTDKQIINQVKGTFTNQDANVSLRLTLHDVNKPVHVTKPQNAKTLLEILGSSLSGQMDALGTTPGTETSVELQPLYN